MVGLHSGTHSKLVVLGGIFTIAVADAFSDALGIHISEEYEHPGSTKQIWVSTIATLLTKFFFAMTFMVPVLLLPLQTAIVVSLAWGLLALTVLSYVVAKTQGQNPWRVVGEHIFIAIVVILITHTLGDWIGSFMV
jgi:VIT1/CCC1 family predicted Fe2+/Mn2+ transporter